MEYSIGTEVLNGWKIVNLIGEGAFGKVYEIQKNNYGVIIKSALKVIHIPQSKSDVDSIIYEGMDEKSVTSYFQGVVQDIVREITVMGELKGHPNIVNCEDYSVVEYQDTMGWDILIRMELLTPLQEYVKQHELTEKEVIKIGQDLCKALSLCQKKGLVHRDIKPANIFINDAGEFKLGDFGIARSSDKTSGALSKKGTESYMAPEVYLGKDYDARADFYSVGLVLYNLMNNKRLPFMPDSGTAVRFEDRENAVRKRMSGEEVPNTVKATQGFNAIIKKMCAFNPEDRYQTADEMLSALNNVDDNKVMASAEKRPEQKKVNNVKQEKPEKKKGKTGVIIAGVAVLVLVLVGAFAIKYFTSPQYAVKGESEELYEKACQQVEDGEYEEAMKTLDKISEDWAKYDDAVDKRAEVVEKYKEKVMEEAEVYLEKEDYISAISVLDVALKVIGSDDDIEKKLILANIKEYQNAGEYEKAITYINDKAAVIDDDSDILFELSHCEQKYRDVVLKNAEDEFQEKGYEAALKIVDNALNILPDDEELEKARTSYLEKAPVAVVDLEAFKSDYGNKKKKDISLQDKLGNSYLNCIQYSGGSQGYMGESVDTYSKRDIYVIGKKYSTFKATLFVPESRTSYWDAKILDTYKSKGAFTFRIFGDGKLLYQSPLMVSTQYPVEIEIDISGVEQLAFSWATFNDVSAEIGLANAYLYK